MKKLILLTIMAVMTAMSSWAVTDGQTYAKVNGIGVKNLWIFDRVHANQAYLASPICHTNARTATMTGGVVYVSRSQEKQLIIPNPETGKNDTILQGVIHCFDALSGEPIKDLDLTFNGNPYGVFLGNTSIGCDNFGHIWVAPMTSASAIEIPIYQVDTESGEMTLVTNMYKGDMVYRTDYLDLIGDLTLEEAECNIMTIAHNSNDPGFPTVYRWHNEQGGDIDTWEGGFYGDPYMDFTEFYPAEKVGFSLAPVIKMLLGTDDDTMYSGEYFYIDCFDGAPVLYYIDGTVVDSFENVPQDLWPTRSAANGMTEFTLEGRHFFSYVKADMNGNGNGCQINVCELGDGDMLETMTKYWQLPADSVGKINDNGLRVHCIATEKGYDDEGNEEITLFTFKAYNGMGVYKIGSAIEPDGPVALYGDVNGDGTVTAADITSLYDFLLNGDTSSLINGDVNGDGDITAADITSVYDVLLGN
ncbi:MAG: dockerin type I repeat-containing protein [Muribaculaceae bacterium]|nr:dockerin type I repeat-containing protein [Muribaculaceae bacterium]